MVLLFFCFSYHDELMLSPSQFATRALFMPEQKNSLFVQEISQDLEGLDFLYSDIGFLFDIGKIT